MPPGEFEAIQFVEKLTGLSKELGPKMEASNTVRRLKVVFFPHPTPIEGYWEQELLTAISRGHDITVFDRNYPAAEQIAGHEVVVDFGGQGSLGEIDIAAAAGIQFYQAQTTGLDHVQVEPIKERGMLLAHCPGYLSSVGLAESALMYMLMLAHRFRQAAQNFEAARIYEPFGENLTGRVLTIFGFGASGQALARYAKSLGLRIFAIDVRPIEPGSVQEMGLESAGSPDDLDRFAAQSDYLSLHAPLTEQTRHIVNARLLGKMKPTACVINIARGALVNEEALYDALLEGRIGGAGLDVFAQEPPDVNHPVFQLPNVIATPHTATSTIDTARQRAEFAAGNLDRFSQGLEPHALV